jgi:hypothetical protein
MRRCAASRDNEVRDRLAILTHSGARIVRCASRGGICLSSKSERS